MVGLPQEWPKSVLTNGEFANYNKAREQNVKIELTVFEA